MFSIRITVYRSKFENIFDGMKQRIQKKKKTIKLLKNFDQDSKIHSLSLSHSLSPYFETSSLYFIFFFFGSQTKINKHKKSHKSEISTHLLYEIEQVQLIAFVSVCVCVCVFMWVSGMCCIIERERFKKKIGTIFTSTNNKKQCEKKEIKI